MRYMVYGFFAYAFVNFMFFMTKAPSGSNGANPPAEVWRGSPGIGWRSTQPRSLFSILLLVPRIQACGVPTGIQHRPLLPTVRGAVNCPQSSVTAEAEDGDSASLESHPNWIGIATFRPPFNQQMSRGPRTNSRMHALSARYS